MNQEDSLDAFSDAKELYAEEIHKSSIEPSHHANNLFNHIEAYSDIYFDKSIVNVEEASGYDMSNYPKEINLEEDQISEDEIFLKPDIVDYSAF